MRGYALAALLCCAALAYTPRHAARRPVKLDRRSAMGLISIATLIVQPPGASSAEGDVDATDSTEIGGLTSMMRQSQPDLGIILLGKVRSKGSALQADLLLADKISATAAFDAGPGFAIAKGSSYDVEAKNKEQDNAFLQVVAGGGKNALELPSKVFRDAIFSLEGRYGLYGTPIDVKLLSDAVVDNRRLLEFSFTGFSPSLAEVPRKVAVAALQPADSSDVVVLVSGCSVARWKAGGDAVARAAASSLKLVSTQASTVEKTPQADYRYGMPVGPDLRGSLSKPTSVYNFKESER